MSCRTAICKPANTNTFLIKMQPPIRQKAMVLARLAGDVGRDVKVEPVSR